MKKKKITPPATISFQILPKAGSQKDMIRIVDKTIALIKASGVSYEVGPMETTMEGELGVLIEIVKSAQYAAVKAGASSVFSNVKILYDPKGVMTIEEKVTKHR